MTVIEMRFMEAVVNYLPKLVRELEKHNRLLEGAKEKSKAPSDSEQK